MTTAWFFNMLPNMIENCQKTIAVDQGKDYADKKKNRHSLCSLVFFLFFVDFQNDTSEIVLFCVLFFVSLYLYKVHWLHLCACHSKKNISSFVLQIVTNGCDA